jgi:hypothetical protein
MAQSAIDKNSSLMEIGTHCAECNDLDFLPFKCPECSRIYCSKHRVPESHGCKRREQTHAAVTRTANVSGQSHAQFQSTGQKLGGSSSSSSSSNSSSQRLPPADNVKAVPRNMQNLRMAQQPKPNPMLDKWKSIWSKKPSISSVSTKSSKSSRILELAALKRNATGDTKVPQQNRVYVYIERPQSTYKGLDGKDTVRPSKKVAAYYNKSLVIGRVLDQACSTLEIANHNNSNGGKLVVYVQGKAVPYRTKIGDAAQDGDVLQIDRAQTTV